MPQLKNDEEAAYLLKRIANRRCPVDGSAIDEFIDYDCSEHLWATIVDFRIKKFYQTNSLTQWSTAVTVMEEIKELTLDKLEMALKRYQDFLAPKRLLMSKYLTLYAQ
ncbi:hypothetical protein FRB90_006572, partial [Tulasnella sp. 427]